MEGNIVGEPFDDFVKNQIKIRQSNQFGGYGNSLRTDDQLKYLTNRNAWVKLASSVDVLEGDIITPLTGPNGASGGNGGVIPRSNVFTPGQGSGINIGNTGTSFPQSPSGAIPGLTGVQSINYKSEKLRQIGIKDPEKYSGSKLAEKAILFNSISSFNSINTSYSSSRAGVTNVNDLWSDSFAYGIGGTDYGIQPPPGITGATVDSINRGSIRKANVTLKAHNKFQFDIIELLYLRLGFTMMLEWGWDKYLDSETGDIKQVENTIIEEKWFTTSTGISQLQMLGYIQETREKYDGNYDGFFGKVSNFTWNFNPDGTYDIAIDLITVGDVIESLKVNTVAKQKLGEITAFADPTGITEKFYGPNVTKASLLNSLGAFLFAKIDYMVQTGVTGLTSNVGGLPSLSYAAIRINESAIVLNSGDSRAADNLQKYFYYVRLGTFLAELQNLIVPQIQNGTSTTPQLCISYDAFSNLISYFPNQISFDPKVCIFQFSDSLNSYGDITGINSPFLGSGNVPLDSYLQVNQGLTHGMLMNLYINIEFLSELLVSNGGPDQELSLFKFMQDLCNGINNALGGVNKLEPVIKDDSTLVIIDQTLSVSVEDTVKLEVYGYNPTNQVSNFVKDVKFVSKITPQFASMVSIGATAAGSSTSEIDGTAFSKWSEGLVDRFTQKILEPLVPPAAPVSGSADRELYRKIYIRFQDANPSFFQNFYKIIGVIEKDSVLKKINDPYYSTLYLKVMGFETFFVAASKFDEEQRAKGIFKPGEITNLVDKNYAFYLANAFGGIVTSILIAESETGNARNPFATQTTYTHPEISPGQARYFEYNDTFISQGKAVYKNYITALNNNRFAATNTPSSEIGFIPLSFDLILEGISGIKIYNKLSINNNFLPSNYPESLNFIITKVNHNISNNSWDTSLSTISIPRTEPYKFIPSQVSNNGIESVASTLRKDPKTLTTSNRGIEFIKKKEYFLPYAYDDKSGKFPPPKLTAATKIVNNKIVATGGTLSIGYGFTNAVSRFLSQPIVWNSTMTQAEADEIITKIIRESFEKTLQRTITAPLTQYEFDALISILYNAGSIGNESAGLPTPLKDTLNNRDYQGAANIIPRYRITQNGLPNTGLQSRRAKEQQVFISGNYGL